MNVCVYVYECVPSHIYLLKSVCVSVLRNEWMIFFIQLIKNFHTKPCVFTAPDTHFIYRYNWYKMCALGTAHTQNPLQLVLQNRPKFEGQSLELHITIGNNMGGHRMLAVSPQNMVLKGTVFRLKFLKLSFYSPKRFLHCLFLTAGSLLQFSVFFLQFVVSVLKCLCWM